MIAYAIYSGCPFFRSLKHNFDLLTLRKPHVTHLIRSNLIAFGIFEYTHICVSLIFRRRCGRRWCQCYAELKMLTMAEFKGNPLAFCRWQFTTDNDRVNSFETAHVKQFTFRRLKIWTFFCVFASRKRITFSIFIHWIIYKPNWSPASNNVAFYDLHWQLIFFFTYSFQLLTPFSMWVKASVWLVCRTAL